MVRKTIASLEAELAKLDIHSQALGIQREQAQRRVNFLEEDSKRKDKEIYRLDNDNRWFRAIIDHLLHKKVM